MNGPSAVTAAGLVLDIAGAVILALGLVLKTPEATLDESTPKWNFNAALDASLASQSADAQVGAATLVAGFGVQMGDVLGWHEDSWTATLIGIGLALVVVAIAWLFLIRHLRPHRIRALLAARLMASDMSLWWPILAAYGAILGLRFDGDPETIAEYGERVLGRRLWEGVIRGRQLPDVMTKPRSDLPGTREYDAAHATNHTR